MSNLRIGLLFLFGMGSLGSFKVYLDTADVAPDSEYRVHAIFDDASGLTMSSRVRIAGIDVGHIETIELVGAKAKLTLRLRNDVDLYEDAQAGKRPEGILGTNNVELIPGTPAARRLADGEEIKRVNNKDPITEVTETLSETAKQIKEVSDEILLVAKSLRQFISPESSKEEPPLSKFTRVLTEQVMSLSGTADRLLRRVDGVLDTNSGDLRSTIIAMKNLSEQLDQLTGEETRAPLQSMLRNMNEATAGLNRVLGEVEALAGTGNAEAKSLASTLRRTVDSLAEASDQVQKTAAAASSGKGPVGRLLSDESLGDKLDQAVSGLSDLVASYDRLQTHVELGGGVRMAPGGANVGGRAGLRVDLLTRKNKGYLLGLNSDNRVSPQVDVINGIRRSTVEDNYRLTALFWQRFGAFGFKGGLMDGRGGVGLEGYAFRDRLRLSVDAYDFERSLEDGDQVPRHRAHLDMAFHPNLFLRFGVDDPLLQERAYFLGAGVRFLDPDLKRVMAVAPSP